VERTYLDSKSIKIKENPDDLLRRIRLNNKLKEEERIRMRKEQKALNPGGGGSEDEESDDYSLNS
jgi:hypothetical protein